MSLRNIDPAKYDSDEGFVEHKIEFGGEDPDTAAAEQEAEASDLGAEVRVAGEYDGNPTGK